MKYRIYIDEVGNPDMGSSTNPNHRYLSLTGIILNLEYVNTTVFPTLEALKHRYFGSHPDDPIILHRKELGSQKPPFTNLKEPAVRAAFDTDLLGLLRDLEYAVVTVVIDKLEHQQRYQEWRFDPYHYCLTVIIECYTKWLQKHHMVGDVMAESRGGKEDMRLKASFTEVYQDGTQYVSGEMIRRCLTSKELKVKSKMNNIAGLQLADLIAHPGFRLVKARHERQALQDNFGGQIATILEARKYLRSPSGKIEGWGWKWLP